MIPFIASLLSNVIVQRGIRRENCVFMDRLGIFKIPFSFFFTSYITQKKSANMFASFLKAVFVLQ